MAKKQKNNYIVVEVKKENELNRLLRYQKRSKKKAAILFTSEWDEHCSYLLKRLFTHHKTSDNFDWENSKQIPLFIVNSFNTPHSFVIYDVKKAPTLVNLEGGEVYKEEYTPNIWHKLGI